MNKSRREFLGKRPSAALAADVGVASGVAVASGKTTTASDGNNQLLDAFIHGQAAYNGNFYLVDERLLEVLRMIIPHVAMDAAAATAKLDEAERILICGDPA